MKLEAIRALVDAATPGPWEPLHAGSSEIVSDPEGVTPAFVARCADVDYRTEDRDFIAASRTLMPKLLAVAEAAKHLSGTISNSWLDNALEDLEAE